MADAARLDAANPWPGLASFGEPDRAYFRGRETEADELARLVRRERLTVLFGRSGLGKSSLINAGLFPRLREDLHLPVYLRIGYGAAVAPRQQIWDALAAACAQNAVQAPPPEAGESLWAYFHRAGAGFWNVRRRPLLPVLVFDQFEELFTVGRADDAARAAATAFVDELADLVEDRPSEALQRALDADPALGERLDFERRGCKVVLSFREDFLAEVEGLRRRMPSLMRNRYRLLPMNAEQARAVVGSGGPLVDADVAERILGLAWRNRAEAPTPEEAESLEVDPALLSVICSELNLRRLDAGETQITPALLAGAETEILSGFYERSLDRLDARVRAFVEDELITAAGYRDSYAYEDAHALPGVTEAALARLVSGRLLRVDERFGVRRLELTHDVLTRVVKDSRDARRAREAETAAAEREQAALLAQQQVRRRERRAWAGGVGAALLLAFAVLAGVWAIRLKSDAEASWLIARNSEASASAMAASAAAAQAVYEAERAAAEKRLLDVAKEVEGQQARADVAIAAASAASAAAQAQTRIALATDLIVGARATPDDQLPLQLLLGAEVVKRFPERLDGQLEQLARLVASHRIRRLLDLGSITASAASGDGTRVLAVAGGSELVVLDVVTPTAVGRWPLGLTDVNRVLPSADASAAIVVSRNQAYFVRLPPGARAQPAVLGGPAPYRLALSADAAWAATMRIPNEVQLWATRGPAPEALHRVTVGARVAPLCVSFEFAAGKLALGTADATHLVDLATGQLETRPLQQPAIARSADCVWTLWRRGEAGAERAVVLVDARNDAVIRQLRQWRPEQKFGHLEASLLPGATFVRARIDDVVELWPIAGAGGGEVRSWKSEQAPVRIAASGDGRWLAMAFDDGKLTLDQTGDEAGEERIARLQRAQAMYFGADDSLVIVGEGGLLQSVRLGTPSTLQFRDRAYRAEQIEFSAAGTHIGAGGYGLPMSLWDARTGAFAVGDDSISMIEFSADGKRYAARLKGAEPRIRVLELGSTREVDAFTLDGVSSVETASFDPSGQLLALATDRGFVVRDLRQGRDKLRVPIAGTKIEKLAFDPHRPLLAATMTDGSVRAYSLDYGQLRWSWPVPPKVASEQEFAKSVAYAPDGAELAVGRSDGVVALHDAGTGMLITVLRPLRRAAPEGAQPVLNLVFIEGSTILAAGNLDGPKQLYDQHQRKWLAEVGVRARDLKAVAISASGRRFALKHADDTVSLHSWDPTALVRDACDIAGRNLSCVEWRQRFRDEPYRRTCTSQPEPVPRCTAAR